MTTDRVVQQQLIAKGESQGFITYDDILALVPSAGQDVEALEDLMEDLSQAGIVILSEPPAEAEEVVEPGPAELEEALEEIGPLDFDLRDDPGYQQAIETD